MFNTFPKILKGYPSVYKNLNRKETLKMLKFRRYVRKWNILHKYVLTKKGWEEICKHCQHEISCHY